MFFPGETITHVFIIPFNINEIDHVVLSYKQNGAIMFEKTVTSGFEEDSSNSTKISFPFSQSESLLFEDNSDFTIQCNVYTTSGSRHTSHEMSSNNGIQYLRDVLVAVPVRITSQPENAFVGHIGDIASFYITAQGATKYQWQYQIGEGNWQDAENGRETVFRTTATLDHIDNYRYRCLVYDYKSNYTSSNIVKITYIIGGDG